MVVIKPKVMEKQIGTVSKKHCILQPRTWRMTVHYACGNLEPPELTGLRLCLHDLGETAKLKRKVPINWLLISGHARMPASPLFLPIAGST